MATQYPQYMTPGEVARAFCVDSKSVQRWSKTGKLTAIRTPGGHRRFLVSDVLALLALSADPRPKDAA
jgi:excisionase family DNA binding protein